MLSFSNTIKKITNFSIGRLPFNTAMCVLLPIERCTRPRVGEHQWALYLGRAAGEREASADSASLLLSIITADPDPDQHPHSCLILTVAKFYYTRHVCVSGGVSREEVGKWSPSLSL